MTFNRTLSSLPSLHLFLGVDVVLFSEGGDGSASVDSQSAADAGRTCDEFYWSEVMHFLNYEGKFRVKSLGSKTALKVNSEFCVENAIDTIFFCADRDYEYFTGESMLSYRAMHTQGYSWENDVLENGTVDEYIALNYGTDVHNKYAASKGSIYANLERVKHYCEIDITMIYKKATGFFDREKKNPFMRVGKDFVEIDFSSMESEVLSRNFDSSEKLLSLISFDSFLISCYGKFISQYIFHSVRAFILKETGHCLPSYNAFMRSCIFIFFRRLKEGRDPQGFSPYIMNQWEKI